MQNNTEFLKQNLIAHRGMHNSQINIPENSIPAFQKALENKYIIELDLHILKDKSIVVFHDNNLERMAGVNKNINDCNYNDIKDLKLQNTNNYIPLFQDVLKLVDGKVPLIIELKYECYFDMKTGELEEKTMELLKNYKGKYAIKSFNPFSIYYLRKHYPSVVRGQLASGFKYDNMGIVQKFILKKMLFNYFSKPDFISYDINGLPNKYVSKFRENKLVMGWTIRSKNDLEFAKKYCDNFICENVL